MYIIKCNFENRNRPSHQIWYNLTSILGRESGKWCRFQMSKNQHPSLCGNDCVVLKHITDHIFLRWWKIKALPISLIGLSCMTHRHRISVCLSVCLVFKKLENSQTFSFLWNLQNYCSKMHIFPLRFGLRMYFSHSPFLAQKGQMFWNDNINSKLTSYFNVLLIPTKK